MRKKPSPRIATSKSFEVGSRVALAHHARRADGLHAGAELDAGRQDVALVGGLRADAADVLVQQVLELGALALVAGGAHVRDVVGDDLDVELLGHHSRRGGVQCAHGILDLLAHDLTNRHFGEPARSRLRRSSPCCCRMPATSE